jgi:hypothetical protein
MTPRNRQKVDRMLSANNGDAELEAHMRKTYIKMKSANMEMAQLREEYRGANRPPTLQLFLRTMLISTRCQYLETVMSAATRDGIIFDATDTLDEDLAPLLEFLDNHPEIEEELWPRGR